MYRDTSIAPKSVNDLFDRCYELSKTSTCNKRDVGAVLQLSNEDLFEGSNGSKEHPCKLMGPEYCTRDSSVGTLEYLTCPSYCAEGEAILKAYLQEQDLENAKLFTTGFPCQRCKDLIIHFKLGEVYFSTYKNGSPRLFEELYAAEMTSRGIKVFETIETELGYALNKIVFERGFELFARNARITPGESWLKLFLDETYRNNMLHLLQWLKNRTTPIPENFNGLTVQAIL